MDPNHPHTEEGEDHQHKATLTKHLHQEWKTLVDPEVSPEDRMAQAKRLRPYLSETDAYITLKGNTKGLLPGLNWNASFRKAYSLLFWVRPRLIPNNTDKDQEDDNAAQVEMDTKDGDSNKAKQQPQDDQQRILYRFASHSHDARAVGVCAVLSQWQANADQTTIETTLTAYSLPHVKLGSSLPPNSPSSSNYSSFVRVNLTLQVGEWQLVGINHTFPYLKRPVWSIAVDGRVLGQGELAYPVCENRVEMQDNQVLQNLVLGGVQHDDTPETKTDDQKTASELNARPKMTCLGLEVDVASLSLYPDPISTSIQAVVAEAGPNLSLQKGGRVLPTLPPVPNWSKGSSMEGPKVGIPLTVHSSALDLQRLSGKFIFGVSALSARVLGQVGSSQRLVCPLALMAGSTESTPRVGLVRPAEPIRLAEEDLPVLYLVGNASVFHAMTDYLLNTPEAADLSNKNLDETTRNLSIALQEQNLLSLLVMPFFLALCPPGKLYDMHNSLYSGSIRQLYALYSNDGAFAAQLILLLADYLRTGGARVHEEALQGGILHVLAACLRLSLLRCQRVKFFRDTPNSLESLKKCFDALATEEVYPQSRHEGTSPSFVPSNVVDAVVVLLEACCGKTTSEMDELSPAMQIRRTSDTALTAVFGLALDMDLWGGDAVAASRLVGFVAERYGGTSLTSGYILRSQVSVQYFLDCIRLRYDGSTASPAVEDTAQQFSLILQSMLLSSLSNRRSISQGEHDICSCMCALTDSPLGSVGAHVVLNAIIGVLAWCEVLPVEMSKNVGAPGMDDERKMHLASRLGRNLLMAQFHDVIAPMILSRTVFSGERTLSVVKTVASNSNYDGSLSWSDHWQLTLLLFSWVASIAGAEGLISAKSAGSLLLASSVAGSLKGALDGSNKDLMNGLFLPPPAIALMIGSTIRDEWSYTDLLSDRLQIMMPLVPGMVNSLISSFGGTEDVDSSIAALKELLRAVGGTFHRVFGGMIHSTGGARRHVKNSRDGFADSIKAARTYVPHLIAVAMALEDCIVNCFSDNEEVPQGGTRVMRPQTSNEDIRRTDLESWVDLSTESVISEVPLDSPTQGSTGRASVQKVLRSCQNGALNTAAGLAANSMNLGGAGASVPLWHSVLAAFKETAVHVGSFDEGESSDAKENPKPSPASPGLLAQNVLCRLVSIVLIKSLKREFQWEVWNYELSSAVSGLVMLVEEKGLLGVRKDVKTFSVDQVILLNALVDVLEYGRDATGWCQLALPAMSSAHEAKTASPMGELSENSKLLLPILLPCTRLLLEAVEKISTNQTVIIPGGVSSQTQEINETSEDKEENLLSRVLKEFESTLTAAIVGLSFSGARDIALNSMATMRKAMSKFEQVGEMNSAEQCRQLLCKVAEELRQRYKAERQLRETTLFDAYENREEDGEAEKAATAAEESIAVERLLLGGDVTGMKNAHVEEINFSEGKRASGVSEDFVLFGGSQTEKAQTLTSKEVARLGFAQYEGLGAALEESTNAGDGKSESILAALTPYLDSWDLIAKQDEEEAELVKLFDSTIGLGPDGQLKTNELESADDSDQPRALVVQGSDSAADAMSTFFEFAAAEKSRLRELSFRFLPSSRYSRISYSERFCWARFSEIHLLEEKDVWERGIPDGNRDMRSRIPSVPFSPQFRRFIPKYLDHGGVTESPEELETETNDKSRRRSTAAPAELDAITKTLLQTGKLEIVDITKQELEDDGPDLDLEKNRPDSMADTDDDFYVESENNTGDSNHKSSDDEHNDNDTNGKDTTMAEDDTVPTEEATDTGEYSFAPDETVGKTTHHSITSSAFATPPDNASSSLGLMHSAAAGMIEMHLDSCLHVKPEGSRQCAMLLTSTHLILEYDAETEGFYDNEQQALQEEVDRQQRIADDVGPGKESGVEDLFHQKIERRQKEVAAMRPKSIRWNLSEVSHVYLRRYRLRDSSIELFFIPSGGTAFGGPGMFSPSCSVFLDFGPGKEGMRRRNEAAYAMMKRAPPQAIKQWPDRAVQFLHDHITKLTIAWVEGRITNFDYLLHLNILSGRSYNDICQYPVMPWVLGDYTSTEIPDLTDRKNFRDLSKPVGALNPDRLHEFLERFETFADPSIPPFMYGSHYSTSAGVVLHFLVRLHPFAGLHRQLQSGHFDVADRLFSSVPRTWGMCTGQSAAEVKELTPEWYCNPAFLRNSNNFKLGTSQDGDVLGDVELPPWANKSPEKFVEVMRAALESDICSEMLSDWIDLIFGRKQQGPEAIKAHNVFFYLTYYGSVDVASIEDEGLRQATELQIAHFGQCPMQLFRRPHVRRLPRSLLRPHFYQLISLYAQTPQPSETESSEQDESQLVRKKKAIGINAMFGEPNYLPFFSAPLSYWIHLEAPPPGPHASLVAVRLAGVDRCLAVDAKGIFHTFRWAWRNDESEETEDEQGNFHQDSGCFIAQRELPRFRSVPRLMHEPVGNDRVAIAISKTLFAGRSVLLVLSAGDSRGGLGMQLVDPAKGVIRGEVMVPSVHSARITSMATDPIGTAAGQGGVGGELAVVGSADGNASLWRFMSSHYLPLRPRNRLSGHEGSSISAVGLCSAIHIAVTVSQDRCCVHSVGNGTLLRSFPPPENTLDFQDAMEVKTRFAETQAIAISVQGYIATVCQTTVTYGPESQRTITTLHLFNMEGICLGSQPLESWRGLPNRMHCTPDGTILFVCTGRGVTMHRLSAVNPLQYVDEWQIAELDDVLSGDVPACFDMDLGPSLSRPVCAAAACSGGVLRLHALPGISSFSERHRKGSLTQSVGTAFANPAKRFNRAFKEGLGFGSKIADMGRDIGKEVQTDVKEKGVGGFLGSMLFRKNTS